MKNKYRNLGFSLVELVVAFAILGIATVAIGGFYVSATRSSTKVRGVASLENEAQLTTNQLENLVKNVELGMAYKVAGAGGSSATFVYKDSEASLSDIQEKTLYIIDTDESGDVIAKMVKWDKSKQELLYNESAPITNVSGADYSDMIFIPSGEDETMDAAFAPAGEWEIMAEDVADFSVVISEDGKKANFSLLFENEKAKYTAEKTVGIRNDAIVDKKELNTAEAIFASITSEIKEEVLGIQINISPKLLGYGGAIILDTEVEKRGNPDYEIYYQVSDDEAMSEEAVERFREHVAVEDNKLMLTNEAVAKYPGKTLYVQATLLINGETATPTSFKSNVESFTVLNNLVVSMEASDVSCSILDTVEPEAVEVETGVSYQFSATADGNKLINAEKQVLWSVDTNSTDVEASISSEGLLKIEKYSAAGKIYVVAAMEKNDSIKVKYPVYVKGYTSQELEIVGAEEINRGAAAAYQVKLSNGEVVDAEDCKWEIYYGDTLVPSGDVVVGTNGVVFVKDSLSYENTYYFTVRATLKRDSDMTGVCVFRVPKVTVKITNYESSMKRGETMDGLKCEVTGVEDYEIDWSMARVTNASHFFTVRGNTRVNGYVDSEGNNLANVTFGGDEEGKVTSIYVKAVLNKNENFSSMITINTHPEIKITIKEVKSFLGIKYEQAVSGDTLKKGTTYKLYADVENESDAEVIWSVTINNAAESLSGNSWVPSKKGSASIKAIFAETAVESKTMTVN